MVTRPRASVALCLLFLASLPQAARADDGPPPASAPPSAAPPPPSEAPRAQLTLDEALRSFDRQGFDLLLADAQVDDARAGEAQAGRVLNPSLSVGVGRAFGYDPALCGAACSPYQINATLSDEALLLDVLAGKRGSRLKAARAAVQSAQATREDTRRTLATQVKLAYLDAAAAAAKVDYAREAQATMEKTLAVNKLRYPKVIDEGALARVETQKLAADQVVDRAAQASNEARVQLAFLIGLRTGRLGADVDKDALKFAVPSRLASPSVEALKQSAREHRPDLRGVRFEKDRAEAQLDAARRERVPDVALNLFYQSQGFGQNAIQPLTLGVGLSAPLPLFYQRQGEVGRAEADKKTQSLTEQKLLARVDADVEAAVAQLASARRMVERYEQGGMLDRARRARDISELQFNAGSAPLIDFLDAQRTFIALSQDYVDARAAYWAAVFRLEEAVGMDLRR